MLTLVLATVVMAAPVHVAAVLDPDKEPQLEALKKALPDATWVDASALHQHLLGSLSQSAFPMFENFQEAPPSGWPEALGERWKESMAHCASVAAAEPEKSHTQAFACGERLAAYLWEQYLQHVKAQRVFVMETRRDPADPKGALVKGLTYEPGVEQAMAVDARGPQYATLRKDVLQRLVKKQGQPQRRKLVTELLPAARRDPFTGVARLTTPVVLKTMCPSLPAKLELRAPGPLGETLMSRWAPPEATGAPLGCTLSYSDDTDALSGMKVLVTSLTCGAVTVARETADPAEHIRPPEQLLEQASTGLLQALSTRLCR